MSAKIWSVFFPGLLRENKATTKVDFRCGFSKEFLLQGELEEAQLSLVKFREGNIIDADLHFGCSVLAFNNKGSNDMDQVLEFFQVLTTEMDDDRWENQYSFFISLKSVWEMDFTSETGNFKNPFEALFPQTEEAKENQKNYFKNMPFITGRVKKWTPEIKQLKWVQQKRESNEETE